MTNLKKDVIDKQLVNSVKYLYLMNLTISVKVVYM